MNSNIIWIASYPKSGNTMIRSFLSTYFFTENGILSDLDILKNIPAFNSLKIFKNIKNFPEIEFFLNNPEKISEYWKAAQKKFTENYPNDIFFFKTHNAQINYKSNFFTSKELTKCFIYVVRDPRSVIVSTLAHYGYKNYKESANVIMSDSRLSYALADGRLPEFLLSWRAHFVSWHNFNKISNGIGIIVKFEDLVEKPIQTFRNILNFVLNKIGKKIDELKFQNSVKSIHFQNLKDIENKIGFKEKSKYSENFFRSGKTDEWKEILNLATKEDIENKFEKEMKYLNYL